MNERETTAVSRIRVIQLFDIGHFAEPFVFLYVRFRGAKKHLDSILVVFWTEFRSEPERGFFLRLSLEFLVLCESFST